MNDVGALNTEPSCNVRLSLHCVGSEKVGTASAGKNVENSMWCGIVHSTRTNLVPARHSVTLNESLEIVFIAKDKLSCNTIL